MAKRQVVEIKCDRCKRIEYIEPDVYIESPDLKLEFGTKESKVQALNSNKVNMEPEILINFPDLCSSCQNTVRNLIDQIRLEAKKKDDPPVESPSSSSQ